ncbi:MAG: phospholipase D-like domain-containing protein [Anaerolineales bacterium]|nr:phospholipase D-like domain-containing protein [Anaerolineales bacterium]
MSLRDGRSFRRHLRRTPVQVSNPHFVRILSALLLILFLAACAPVDDSPTNYRLPVTQIPFYASETPAPFIVPVTDTPIILPMEPATETPAFIVPVTETPIPVPAEKWWEVYFTDPQTINNPDVIAGSIEERLIQFINNAQTSIHISSFEFNLTPVAEALIAAKNRGVDVKWITDDKNGLDYDIQPGRGQFSLLTAAGIEVKDDDRSALMHNKFWIFDQQITWTGSTNITVNGIFKQNNNVLIIRSPEIAFIFEREFQEMWSGQFGPRAPSTLNNQWAILDGTPIQVIFSAEDHAVSNLIALVNDAKVSVRFLAFSFTDYPLAQAMIDRSKAGVDVKGVYETFGSNSSGSELKTFWCAQVPVRQDGNGSFLHDKIIIIDNSIVVTSSLNYSSNADESNEENVVILDNAEIAALYLQEFDKLWNQAHDVEAGTFTCD